MKTLNPYFPLFCLMLLFALVSTTAIAQSETIELNFDTKSITPNKQQLQKLKSGDYYLFKISNINMNLYTVQVNKKDSIIASNVTFPTFDLIGLDAINKVIGSVNLGTISGVSEDITKYETEIQEALSTKNLTNKTIVQNDSTIEFFHNLSDAVDPSNIKKLDSINIELKSKITQIDQTLNYLILQKDNLEKSLKKKSYPDQIKEQISITKILINNILTASRDTLSNINSFLLDLNIQPLAYLHSAVNKSSKYLSNSKLTFDNVISKIHQYNFDIEYFIDRITDIESSYTEFTLSNIAIIRLYKDDTLFKRLQDNLLNIISKAKESLTKAQDKITPEKTAEYLKALLYLENNSDGNYVSMPLQFNGDVSKLTVTITPKKEEYGLPKYVMNYEFPQRSFYVGVGAGFYYSRMRNDVYSVRDTMSAGVDSYSVVNEKQKKGEVGFAVLLHIGGKICTGKMDWLGLHGSIGPSLSLDAKPKARLAIGGGVSIGKGKNMLTIDALQQFGYADRLSNAYSESGSYSAKPEQVTVSRLSNAWAVSVGYIYKF